MAEMVFEHSSQNESLNLDEEWIKTVLSSLKNAHSRLHNMSSKLNLNLFASFEKQINLLMFLSYLLKCVNPTIFALVSSIMSSALTTGFWGKEAWRANPKMEYQVFLCIFQKNSNMATLGLKEMGKFLWEGSKTKLRQPTGQTFFSTFSKEFFHFPQT